MKCDTCKSKNSFDECKWPQLGSCEKCLCNTCEICELPVKVMVNMMVAATEEAKK